MLNALYKDDFISRDYISDINDDSVDMVCLETKYFNGQSYYSYPFIKRIFRFVEKEIMKKYYSEHSLGCVLKLELCEIQL